MKLGSLLAPSGLYGLKIVKKNMENFRKKVLLKCITNPEGVALKSMAAT